MLQPFQCLLYCPAIDSRKHDILLAASGSRIVSFNVCDGSFISTWPAQLEAAREQPAIEDSNDHPSSRPAKRQKTTLARDVSSSDSAEIVVEGVNKSAPSAASTQASTSYVAKLARTVDSKHIIAITAEDKCIRVFNLNDNGSINQISERPMLKRPCAIALSPDETNILCGDKFGDVYSLPLLGIAESAKSEQSSPHANGEASEQRSKLFSPAATPLTVHTKKNLEALKNQQRQAKQKSQKEELKFDHKLLLGHVSLLTDLISIRLLDQYSPSCKVRDYIITADRDEHIRVSRGIPQAHVIEGYCLGHVDFVSKVCVPEQHPQLLLSGGGDGCLLVWDWLSGALRQKVDLRGLVSRLRPSKAEGAEEDEGDLNIAVSGIWDITTTRSHRRIIHVAVVCEAVPAIFLFVFSSQTELKWYHSLETSAHVIDIAVADSRETIFYSLDNTHEKFTRNTVPSEDITKNRPCLGAYDMAPTLVKRKIVNEENNNLVSAMDQWAKKNTFLNNKEINSWLYNLETLRKKTQED